MFKRGVGIILSLCLSLFFAEVAVADVHDGDASASELAALSPGASAAAAVRVDATPYVAQEEQAVGQQTHEHACHCLHAHNGWTPAPVEQVPASLGNQTGRIVPAVAPTQAYVDVEYRPPIASA